ncbi:hypothetical protein QR680_004863 [Steinernema hermaphroditum]|uniref:Cystatin domain-containing protein n=1 Tax=Steinernema hermaphroditum TaxID=289476 RepID=A0AA39HQ36_9BILA|nr:hypothetical protein QR680_004863 [Steinernema hermaphroditum]
MFAFFVLSAVVPLSAVIVGGWTTRDVNDPDVIRVAKESLAAMTICPVSLKIISAKSQVVAGVKYDIQLVYAPDFNQIHELVVVEQPWEKEPLDILSYT